MEKQTEFEDALAELIEEHSGNGLSRSDIISSLELKRMALLEDESEESESD